MSAPVVGTLDFQKNELQNPRIHNNNGAPSSPVVGQVYVETNAGVNRFYVWNGTAWVLKATDSDALGGQTLAQVRDFSQTTGTRDHNAINDFDTQVRLSRLDQMAAPTASVGMNSQKIINLLNGTNPQDAVTLTQLQAVQQGIAAKQEARAATTANLAGVTYTATGGASGRGQITVAPNTLDGVSLGANDRILIKDGAAGNAAADGIWIVTTLGTGANGVWDRATDWDADADISQGAFVFVQEGTVNADSGWQLTTNNPIIVGGASGTALAFAQFSGAGQITAGTGMIKTGNVLDVQAGATPGTAGPGGGLKANADDLVIDADIVSRKKIFQIGNGSLTSIVVNHALNNQWVQVELWENSGSFRKVWGYEAQATDANNVTLVFPVAPTSNQYRVVVVG